MNKQLGILASFVGGIALAVGLLLFWTSPMAQAVSLSARSDVPVWRQSNVSGFGLSTNVDVNAVEVFDGQLYAGVNNYSQGATIWRTTNGISWTMTTSPGFSDTYADSNVVILDLVEFNGQLYAGTGNWREQEHSVGGQIWRSSDGTSWVPVEEHGFGDTGNSAIAALVVFSNTLYAATGGNSNTNGVEIWCSQTGDAGSWTRVVNDGNGDNTTRFTTDMIEFGGYLYANIETTSAAQIWRTNNGTVWAQVSTSGFGDANNISFGGMTIFNGYLYVGTGNNVTGTQLWRSSNGTNWNQMAGTGFGSTNNGGASLVTFDGALYAYTNNHVTGGEVWRSTDGTTWVQDAPDGFGSSQTNFQWKQLAAIFNNSLFIGARNPTVGGQVWQRLHGTYLPLVVRNESAQ